MNFAEIQKLMKEFEDSDIRELKIDQGDFHLFLSKNRQKQTAISEVPTEASQPTIEKLEDTPAAIESSDNSSAAEDTTAVKSPLVGVVYLQAKPGQPAFVKVGNHVKKGDTIAIIEAMKMMTEVKSDVSGVVSSIEVENEDLVEVDQALILVKED